jgi:hypothetical protein
MLQYRGDPKALHKALRGIKTVYEDLPEKEQTNLGENYLDDLANVFNDYNEHYADEELPIETEQEFLVPIGKLDGELVYFHGIIDEVYENDDLGEHKTFNFRPSMSILAMNMQSMLYAKARVLTGHNLPERIRWDYIKSTPADYPIWLEKSQRFSEASNPKVTHLSWLRACEERGIEDQDMLDKAEQFRHNIDNFFFRVQTAVTPGMVDKVWGDFKLLVKDMLTRGKTNQMMNISRDCEWCSYRPICYAEFTGADVEYVKNKDYVLKEK